MMCCFDAGLVFPRHFEATWEIIDPVTQHYVPEDWIFRVIEVQNLTRYDMNDLISVLVYD